LLGDSLQANAGSVEFKDAEHNGGLDRIDLPFSVPLSSITVFVPLFRFVAISKNSAADNMASEEFRGMRFVISFACVDIPVGTFPLCRTPKRAHSDIQRMV
jgi:hypothetical protein